MPDMEEHAIGRPTCIAIHRCKEVYVDMNKPFEFLMQPKMDKAKWEIPVDHLLNMFLPRLLNRMRNIP